MYPGWEEYKVDAVKSRDKYNSFFSSILRQYGIRHEAATVSGVFNYLHCRFQERRNQKDVQDMIISRIQELRKCMRQEFHEEFSSSSELNSIDSAIMRKASAWYVVTYSNPYAKLLSFPWIVSDYLANIKLGCAPLNRSSFSPAVVNLDKELLQAELRNLLPTYQRRTLWKGYDITCGEAIIVRAFRTLLLWAQGENLFDAEGFLDRHKLMQIFVHVSEKLGYVKKEKHPSHPKTEKNYSSAHLVLEFFKFCSSFRSCRPDELHKLLLFDVDEYEELSKAAVNCYYKFAFTGKFKFLNTDNSADDQLRPSYKKLRRF